MVKNDQIDSSSKKVDDKGKDDTKDGEKKKVEKDEKGQPLTEQDIQLIKRYGKGPYDASIREAETHIKNHNELIAKMCGVKESDTGLALPAQWNLQADAMMMKQESTLQVGRCTKILNKGSEDAKYITHLKHMGKFVVSLDEKLAPTDVEEGMRVGT